MSELKKVVYTGELEEFHETGMECMGLCLYREGFETPNPDYIEGSTKYPHNVPAWRSYEGLVFIKKGDHLTIFKEDGTVELEFNPVVQDNEAAKEDGYRFSIYPQGVDMGQFYLYFLKRKNQVTGKIIPPRKATIVRYEKEQN